MNQPQIEVPMLQEYSPPAAPPRRRAPADARALAGERLRARRRQVTRIRKRVIATALVMFAVLWAVIFVQLVSGNDPALSQKTTVASKPSSSSSSGSASTSTTTSSAPTSSTAGSGAGTSSGTGSGSGTTSSGSSGTTSAVTTSQS